MLRCVRQISQLAILVLFVLNNYAMHQVSLPVAHACAPYIHVTALKVPPTSIKVPELQPYECSEMACNINYCYWMQEGLMLAPSDELAQAWVDSIARVENSDETIQAKFSQMLRNTADYSMTNTLMNKIFPEVYKTFHNTDKEVIITKLVEEFNKYKQVHEADLKQARRFLGEYSDTAEFRLQEESRKNDLFLSNFIKRITDADRANAFLINGWGQTLGTLMALKNAHISSDFKKVIDQNLKTAVLKGKLSSNPFMQANVRGSGKEIWMYPHQGKYYPFQPTGIKEPIAFLNRIVTEYKPYVDLYNSKLFLKIEPGTQTTIFKRVWETNLKDLLTKNGFRDIEPIKQLPHITLFLPEVYAAIKQKFNDKGKHDAFEPYMKELVARFNAQFDEVKNPVTFTELSSAYSEDYAPYKVVIVAKVKAPEALTLFNELRDTVKKDTGVEIPELKESDLHFTLGAEFRKANEYPIENVSQLLNRIPEEYSKDIEQFFNELTKPNAL